MPEFTPCFNQCASGCAAYETRPDDCRIYACAWLSGWGEEDDRPDKLGIVFDDDLRWREQLRIVPFIRATECVPGAAVKPEAQRALIYWMDAHAVFFYEHGAVHGDQTRLAIQGRPHIVHMVRGLLGLL